MPQINSVPNAPLADTLKALEHKVDAVSHGVGREHQPNVVLRPGRLEQPRRPPEIKPTEQIRPTEQALAEYAKVDEDHPEQSPYVVKQAGKRDQVMTDDVAKSPTVIAIEEIMADGLGDAYQKMSPTDQDRFRKKGEEVARAIAELTTHFKATAKRVLQLIRDWLRLIPGVNNFFLEQEAKIKTDELLQYARKHTKL